MQTLEYDTPSATAEHVADSDITAAVELFFITQKGVAAHLIDVATHAGIVRLTGITDNLLSRERAEEIALALRGVQGVVNELIISTPDVPDEALQHDAARALDADPATSDYNVRAAAAGGVLTLSGAVQSWAEKELVLRVVRGVRGVRRVEADELHVRWGENVNSDEQITTQIRELLDWDIRVRSTLVEVRTEDRRVQLWGTVGTAAEKAHVVTIAYQAGATAVEARDLFVASWASSSALRPDQAVEHSDADIAQAVLDAFRFDPRVLAYQPVVTVHRGLVTLSGTVSNLRARQDAERDARHVVGVWDVQNLLRVRSTRFIPDLHIGQTIKEALARDPYVGFREFTVFVQNGKASLYGLVNSQFEREQAGDVASGVNGVAALDNWVKVPDSPGFDGYHTYSARPSADFTLAQRIRNRLFWSASLHGHDLTVEVKKDRATLSGTVATWLDRERAAREAYAAGARHVDNELLVATMNGMDY